MKLLLFGGTFDPPHYGHMSILQNAIAAVGPGRVVVMPAGIPPHKAASATPAGLRMAMCRCFCPLFENLSISDMEIRRGGKSYTWHTVQTLQTENPGAHIYLCIGSDMLLSFTAWYRYEDLLKQVVLVVQNRRRADADAYEGAVQALTAMGGRILLASGEVEEVSSSALRRRLAAGEDPSRLVPPPADALIKKYNLYKWC